LSATAALNTVLQNESTSRELNVIKWCNIGRFYKCTNCRLSHKSGIASVFNHEGDLCITDSSKAESFSSYFSAVYTIDNGLLPSSDNFPIKPIAMLASDSHCSLSSVYFDNLSVYHCISKLRNGSSPGPDNLPPVIFKQLAVQLTLQVSIIFNICMQSDSVPFDWLTANVVSVFKKGAHS